MGCKSIILILLVVSWQSLLGQQNHFIQKAAELDQLYKKAVESPDNNEYCQAFFNAFPNSFTELDSLYGFHKEANPLYRSYTPHIDGLFKNLTCMPDTTYFKKLIHLGIGGHWDADAVNSIQGIVHDRFLKQPRLAFQLLNQFRDPEVSSFFYFFFHGIHAPFKEIPEQFNELRGDFPRVFSNMKAGFKLALADSDDH